MSRSQLWFSGLCLACFLLLLGTAIPAPFTIDDCNYLSSVAGLRHGTLFVPGTADLPASRAFYSFEPSGNAVQNPVAPVPNFVPPLYAVLAFPFSYLGWNELVFLNVLACIATAALVFGAAAHLTGQARAGWYAAALWLLGASTFEYAQGLWPHMLAVALTTGGLVLAALAAGHGRPGQAAAAGFLLALAAGMRYQNAVLLACGLLVLLVWGKTRLRIAFAFCLGALPLVVLSAFINHARIASWHPFSKGGTYLKFLKMGTGGGQAASPQHGLLLGLWTKVVDYSAQPELPGQVRSYLNKLPAGDMVTNWGVLKKSWLQASPWVLAGLLVLLLAWSRRDRFGASAQRHLRIIAIPVVAVLAVFGLAGARHDGLSFNQRYLLELAPLVAMALAVALARLPMRWPWLLAGGGLGTGAAAFALLAFAPETRFRLQSLLPLVLAGAAAGLWLASLRRPRFGGPTGLAVAACLAWSLAIHLSTDLRASRLARHFNTGRLAIAEEAMTPARPTAIVGALGPVDAFCPLLLDHDVVVVTGNSVPAEELPPLLDALLLRRRVLLWLETFPRPALSALQAQYHIQILRPPMLAEITR
jgi:4-amino-4-deoxy-L-arabinose transferase-like glycosyltransferase